MLQRALSIYLENKKSFLKNATGFHYLFTAANELEKINLDGVERDQVSYLELEAFCTLSLFYNVCILKRDCSKEYDDFCNKFLILLPEKISFKRGHFVCQKLRHAAYFMTHISLYETKFGLRATNWKEESRQLYARVLDLFFSKIKDDCKEIELVLEIGLALHFAGQLENSVHAGFFYGLNLNQLKRKNGHFKLSYRAAGSRPYFYFHLNFVSFFFEKKIGAKKS